MLECGFYCSFAHYDVHIVIVLCSDWYMFTFPNLDCTLLRCFESGVLRCWRLLNCVWSLWRFAGCVSSFWSRMEQFIAGPTGGLWRTGDKAATCVKRDFPRLVLPRKEVLNAVVVRAWRHC